MKAAASAFVVATVLCLGVPARAQGQFQFKFCTGSGTPPVGAVTDHGQWALLGNCPSTTPPPLACAGTIVQPGVDTLQPAISAAATGATLCLQTGTYRLSSPAIPKQGQQIVGTTGTIISGAKIISGFAPSGAFYVAPGFLPSTQPPDAGVCTVVGCGALQDVFLDGAQLGRVLSLTALATGKFYADYAANKIYVFDNPAGKLVEQGFATAAIAGTATGVGLKGLIVQMTANQAQHGGIDCQGASGWVMDHLEVRFAHGVGIECDSFTLTNSRVHHNGQMGVGGHGVGIVVDATEIDHNNVAGYNYGWEAGATKFANSTSGGKVTNSNVHDNNGMGLWCDINCYDWTFSNNTVRNNPAGGIFIEISDKVIVSGNTLSGNGPATPNGFYLAGDITISATPHAEVFGNTSTSVVGIGGLQQNRTDTCTYAGSANYPDGTAVCPGGSHRLTDLYVHDNMVAPASGAQTMLAGISADNGDMSVYDININCFLKNTYTPRPSGSFYTWNNNGFMTLAQWQALGLQ